MGNPFIELAAPERTANPFVDLQAESVAPPTNPFMELADKPKETSPITAVLDFGRENIIAPLKQTGNELLDALSFLDRPHQAVAVGAKETIRDRERKIASGERPSPIPSGEAFMEGAKRGFMGEEISGFKDVAIPKEVQKEYPISSAVVGFAGDVATDPLTYAGGAIGKFIVKGVSMAKDAAVKIAPGLVNLADNGVMRAFNVNVGDIKQIKELEGKYRDLAGAAKYRTLRDSKKWNDDLDNLANELKMTPEELDGAIARQVETPQGDLYYHGTVAKFDEFKPIEGSPYRQSFGDAYFFSNRPDRTAARLGQDGRVIAARLKIDNPLRVDGEMWGDPRAEAKLIQQAKAAGHDGIIGLTKSGDEQFSVVFNAKQISQQIGHQSGKPIGIDPRIEAQAISLRNKNAAQINLEKQLGIEIGEVENYFPHVATPAALRAIGKERILDIFRKSELQHASTRERNILGSVESINQKKILGVDEFFYTDPVIAQAVRDIRHANSVSSANFLNEVGTKFGQTANAPSHFVDTGIATLKGTKFDPEVAGFLKRNYAALNSTEETLDFFKVYDEAQNWWKMWSLGARPAYHMRNMVGNVWNNYLAGVKNPAVYKLAGEVEVMETTGKFTGKIGNFPTKQVYDEALNRGVLGKGQYHGDIAQGVLRETEAALSKLNPGNLLTPSTNNTILRAGFKFGQKLEENARLAHFIDRVKKGDTFDQAGKSVKKYLFDYEDLSQVEKKGFKRVMPFYTWTRKNIPLQVEAMLENPQKFQKVNLLRNNISTGDEPDQENVQDYIKKAGPVYVGETPEGDPKTFTLSGYAPFMDIQKILSPKRELMGMVSPFIKEPLEQLFNYDTFRERAITQYDGQVVDFIGVKMPAWLAHVARNIVMVNELDRANPFNIFGQNQVDEATGERQQSNSFGMEEELGVGPFAIGTPRESRQDMQGGDRALQYFTGLKGTGVDEEKGSAFRSLRIKKDLDSLKVYLRQAKRRGKEREAAGVESAIEKYMEKLDEEK